MKLDRMISILMILANKRRVQARELAERFEVSIRTIYRDIAALNQAGIPVVSYQGAGGGIGIAEGFRIDKNFLTEAEIAAVMIALKSVASSYRDIKAELAMEKLKGLLPQAEMEKVAKQSDYIYIDFSSWEMDTMLREKLSLLKEAVGLSRKVSFDYINAKLEKRRRLVEPHTLVFKGYYWYLYAFCSEKRAFRLFKLHRMNEIKLESEGFQRRPFIVENLPWKQEWNTPQNTVELLLRFDQSMEPLVVEWFGIDNVTLVKDDCLVKVTYPEGDWIIGHILSFGSKVEVLEPEWIREEIRKRAGDILKIYQ
ncbi:MAG TPA: YafY family protein [Bacillota bacterium]|nr:YafY family protein [Bacillota bacterium]